MKDDSNLNFEILSIIKSHLSFVQRNCRRVSSGHFERIHFSSPITTSTEPTGTLSGIRMVRHLCIFHPLLTHSTSLPYFPVIPISRRKVRKKQEQHADEINKSTCNFVVVDAHFGPFVGCLMFPASLATETKVLRLPCCKKASSDFLILRIHLHSAKWLLHSVSLPSSPSPFLHILGNPIPFDALAIPILPRRVRFDKLPFVESFRELVMIFKPVYWLPANRAETFLRMTSIPAHYILKNSGELR